MQAIQVMYAGPTDTKGPQLLAVCAGGQLRADVNGTDEISTQARRLAERLIEKLNWSVVITGAGTLKNGDDVFTVGDL